MANPCLITNFLADGAIAQFQIVKPGANSDDVKEAAAATDALIGISTFVPSDDNTSCDVVVCGIADLLLGGTVAFGDQLTSDANGNGVKAVPGAGLNVRTIGIAFKAGVSGDIIPCLIALGSAQG
jgi:hypothetical protein